MPRSSSSWRIGKVGAHFPSGDFFANPARTQLAAIAHNLACWSQLIGLPASSPRMLETCFGSPAGLVPSARQITLRLR